MTERAAAVRAVGKSMLRRVVPHRWRPLVRRLYNDLTWRAFVGGRVRCNCCGGRFRRFRRWSDDAGEQFPMCPRCGSLGRHRVDWLFLSGRTELLTRPTRLLHVAPEPSLERCFRRLSNVTYTSADYDSALAMETIDIADIKYPDATFDAIVCNHVLHYVDDDRQALRELRRVLGPGGWALLQVPVDVSRDETFEDASVKTPLDRARVFGHPDHARIYGLDYPRRLREEGFVVTIDDFVRDIPDAWIEELALDTSERIYLCRRPE